MVRSPAIRQLGAALRESFTRVSLISSVLYSLSTYFARASSLESSKREIARSFFAISNPIKILLGIHWVVQFLHTAIILAVVFLLYS